METITDQVYIGPTWLITTGDDGSLLFQYYENDSYTTMHSLHPPVTPASAQSPPQQTSSSPPPAES